MKKSRKPFAKKTLAQGTYLRLVRKGRWEYVERVRVTGVVVLLAVTPDGKVLFVEQMRHSLGRKAVEFPAGLADQPGESLSQTAQRELIEETGYRARTLKRLFEGPTSAGLTDETITFYLARGLRKIAPGGGDETEKIRVHEVPIKRVDSWLARMGRQGRWIDPKVYAGLYWLALSYHRKSTDHVEGLETARRSRRRFAR